MESTQPILRCRYSYDPLDRLISQLLKKGTKKGTDIFLGFTQNK